MGNCPEYEMGLREKDKTRIRELEQENVKLKKQAKTIAPTHETADAFWRYWNKYGETHKHGYYEATWGAINAALQESEHE